MCLSWLATLASRSPTACACSFKAGRYSRTTEEHRSRTVTLKNSQRHRQRLANRHNSQRATSPRRLDLRWRRARGRRGRAPLRLASYGKRKETRERRAEEVVNTSRSQTAVLLLHHRLLIFLADHHYVQMEAGFHRRPPGPVQIRRRRRWGAGLRTVPTRNEAQPFL